MTRCAHVCNAPLVLIDGSWFHANGAPVHEAVPGDDPRALLRGAEERLAATEARLARAERISAARLEELLRVEARLSAQRGVVEVLAELVSLKDGPRDAEYERRKPLAWERARAVLRAYREAQEGSDGRG